MSLLDKVKNLFTDEEIIEEEDDTVNIREIKKEEKKEPEEGKLPTFMREKIEKEEREKNNTVAQPDFTLKDNVTETDISPKAISKVEINDSNERQKEDNNKFKFPIEFEESDFTQTRTSRQSVMWSREESSSTAREMKTITRETEKNKGKKVSELYKDKKTEKKEEKKFKATPIISPVYGVLDKNYQADEVSQNTTDNFDKHRPSKNVDFDSVRKKAYGSLAEDIKENLMCENCEYLKEAKECRSKKERNNNESNNNLMYDILNDTGEEKPEDITIETATENYYDYGVEYEQPAINNSYYEENIKNTSSENNGIEIINNANSDEEKRNQVKEIPPVKSKINMLSTLKKSAGDEITDTTNKGPTDDKNDKNKDLELTDDLFSLIDSMYEERNDQ